MSYQMSLVYIWCIRRNNRYQIPWRCIVGIEGGERIVEFPFPSKNKSFSSLPRKWKHFMRSNGHPMHSIEVFLLFWRDESNTIRNNLIAKMHHAEHATYEVLRLLRAVLVTPIMLVGPMCHNATWPFIHACSASGWMHAKRRTNEPERLFLQFKESYPMNS